MARLYHKELPDGQNVIEVPDNDGTIAVLSKSGWTKEMPKKYQSEEPSLVGPSEGEGGK